MNRLVSLSSSAPGFYGLNKQQSGDVLPAGWATEAQNCVFDEVGRLATRKGTKNAHSSQLAADVETIHEYIDGAGNRLKIFAADNKLYKLVGSTVTDISGTITTPTGDNWQFTNFNGKCIGVQAGHDPVVIATVGGNFADITVNGASVYDLDTIQPDNVLAAFGRLWFIKDNFLYYSDSLDETLVDGRLDLFTTWRKGSDEGVACAEFNGLLVIFGRRNTAFYQGAADPTAGTFQLVDNIGDIGCIARDSIQSIGTDMLFLSYTGVRSLRRTIQNGVAPLNDVSRNNRDYIIGLYSENEKVKSVHFEKERFYLLSFPLQNKVFVFDVLAPMEDGSYRMTEWDIEHNSFCATYDSTLYIGYNQYVCTYEGYTDGQTSAGVAGTTYPYNFEGPWNDFGQEVEDYIKIPKKGSIHYFSQAQMTIQYKYVFDYRDNFETRQIVSRNFEQAEWGEAEWGEAEWGSIGSFQESRVHPSRDGRIVKFGCKIAEVQSEFALQRIDMQAKIGKMVI